MVNSQPLPAPLTVAFGPAARQTHRRHDAGNPRRFKRQVHGLRLPVRRIRLNSLSLCPFRGRSGNSNRQDYCGRRLHGAPEFIRVPVNSASRRRPIILAGRIPIYQPVTAPDAVDYSGRLLKPTNEDWLNFTGITWMAHCESRAISVCDSDNRTLFAIFLSRGPLRS